VFLIGVEVYLIWKQTEYRLVTTSRRQVQSRKTLVNRVQFADVEVGNYVALGRTKIIPLRTYRRWLVYNKDVINTLLICCIHASTHTIQVCTVLTLQHRRSIEDHTTVQTGQS
jgi:hypothetical protein